MSGQDEKRRHHIRLTISNLLIAGVGITGLIVAGIRNNYWVMVVCAVTATPFIVSAVRELKLGRRSDVDTDNR